MSALELVQIAVSIACVLAGFALMSWGVARGRRVAEEQEDGWAEVLDALEDAAVNHAPLDLQVEVLAQLRRATEDEEAGNFELARARRRRALELLGRTR